MGDLRSIEDLEIDLLLEGVYHRFGLDFRGYTRAPLKSKLRELMQAHGLKTVSGLQEQVMHDARAREAFLRALAGPRRALFHDPEFFAALREHAFPWLRTCPFIKIWVAEHAEDALALAILLEEAGLYERASIYATASDATLLDELRAGVLDSIAECAGNYRDAGGARDFGAYCRELNGRVVLDPRVQRHIVWAQYSLASDASFNEFDLIVCRHVLDAFAPALARRAHKLFYESLCEFGMLALGQAPITLFHYQALAPPQGIFRRSS